MLLRQHSIIDQLKEISELNISGESGSTMNNKKLKKLRTFVHPDLGKTVFEQHVKNFPNSKRMHILSDFSSKKIAVGYFGCHLPTATES